MSAASLLEICNAPLTGGGDSSEARRVPKQRPGRAAAYGTTRRNVLQTARRSKAASTAAKAATEDVAEVHRI